MATVIWIQALQQLKSTGLLKFQSQSYTSEISYENDNKAEKQKYYVYLKQYMFLLLTDLSQVSSSSLLYLSNNLLIWKVHGIGNFKILLIVF